jgi:hypothetical protein
MFVSAKLLFDPSDSAFDMWAVLSRSAVVELYAKCVD